VISDDASESRDNVGKIANDAESSDYDAEIKDS
jgi:hypothetical protein